MRKEINSKISGVGYRVRVMCGIAVIVSTHRDSPTSVHRMLDVQAYRGPSGSGLEILSFGESLQVTLGTGVYPSST